MLIHRNLRTRSRFPAFFSTARNPAAVLLALLVTGAFAVALMGLPTPPTPTSYAPRQLTANAGENLDPTFSPDGRTIAFSSNRTGSYQIWVMDTIGRHQRQLTAITGDARHPEYSPDGRSIAFLLSAFGHEELWSMRNDGTDLGRVTSLGVRDFAWSPDGRILAIQSNESEIWSTNLSGDALLRISRPGAIALGPSWFPSGSEIVFSQRTDGHFQIWKFNSETGSSSLLVLTPGNDIGPSVSPDSRRIAFVSDMGGWWSVYGMNSDGSGIEEWTPPPFAGTVDNSTRLVWNPKSGVLLFQARSSPEVAEIMEINLNTTVVVDSPNRQMVLYGQRTIKALTDWRTFEASPSWSSDGAAILLVSNRGGYFDVWALAYEVRTVTSGY